MPPVDSPVSGTIRYHMRSGEHDVTDYDWQQYLDFVDHAMKNGCASNGAHGYGIWVGFDNLLPAAPMPFRPCRTQAVKVRRFAGSGWRGAFAERWTLPKNVLNIVTGGTLFLFFTSRHATPSPFLACIVVRVNLVWTVGV